MSNLSNILIRTPEAAEFEDEYQWYEDNQSLLRHIQRFATSLTEGGGHGQLILRFADGKFIGSDSEIRERHPVDLTEYKK